MDTMQWIWLALLVVFVVLEGATAAVVSIWFCAGALVALLVSVVFPEALVVQVVVFFAVSIFALLALRPMVRKSVDSKRVATNADANIGKTARVVSAIQPEQFGRVKLEGMEWTAKSDVDLPVDSWCKVVAIDGVKLVVVPADAPE